MNQDTFKSAAKCIGLSYANQAEQAKRTYEKLIYILIEQRKLPQEGWSDSLIERFILELSGMDSNNFLGNVGMGKTFLHSFISEVLNLITHIMRTTFFLHLLYDLSYSPTLINLLNFSYGKRNLIDIEFEIDLN
eukprot:TRINITY_DN3814_c0_g1_i1.p1 TRINITY_DN3814_c0_g1~~TRINITY_DN3814_c0_g1_i1.p1  ORF type:complete len:134 (-),score=4.83 TRINITY_DN3814_c0_g1_i1:339-740(-)